MNKIIECQNLSYAYHNGKIKTPVLNALNLEINPDLVKWICHSQIAR
jgi:energy-coupling factor transporter ATP-binding protein EcfA2